MIYLQLAYEFFKAGLFAVGGGLATLPFLMQTSLKYPQWYSIDELMQMVAVSESTPGPIGMNMASYVGFQVGGIPGSIVATLSLSLPAFLMIIIIYRVLDRFKTNRLIMGGLEALRAAVTGLIAAAGFIVLRSILLGGEAGAETFQWVSFALFLILLGLLRVKALKRIHPVAYIALGAVLGIVLRL